MSVCGQGNEDSVSEETGAPVRDFYQQKAASKIVRVLTVFAYLLSVSLAAILLSVYYVCVWKSPEPPPLNDTEMGVRRGGGGGAAPRVSPHDDSVLPLGYEDYDDEGRSNITVKDSTIRPPTNGSDDVGSTQATEEASSEPYTEPLPDPADLSALDPSNSTSEDLLNSTTSVT